MDPSNLAHTSSVEQPKMSSQPLLVKVSQETSNYGKQNSSAPPRNKFVDKKKSEWSAAKHTFGRNRKAKFSASAPSNTANATDQRTAGDMQGVNNRVIHPYGFRILKDTSAIERSLKGYFRLPPAPSRALREEREHLHEKLLSIEREEARERRQLGGDDGVILDGFLILSAANVENPEEVEAVTLQNSNIVSSVPEDLMYFENLYFVDVSENQLCMSDLLTLPSLEVLHLAYNQIRSLEDLQQVVEESRDAVDADAAGRQDAYQDPEDRANLMLSRNSLGNHGVLLPRLTALNLSCNTIPPEQIILLSYFPCLEKLDLSNNYLKYLPDDMSCLSSVTHLALENNLFSSTPNRSSVFKGLASMPSLMEVNLNNNKLSQVPSFSVDEGRGLCFPSIEIIGLSSNLFKTAESVLPLAQLHKTLRRVVLSKNPMCLDARVTTQTRSLFDKYVVDAYFAKTNPTAAGDDAWGTTDAMWKEEGWSRFLPDQQGMEASDASSSSTPPQGGGPSVSVTAAAAAAAAAAASAQDLAVAQGTSGDETQTTSQPTDSDAFYPADEEYVRGEDLFAQQDAEAAPEAPQAAPCEQKSEKHIHFGGYVGSMNPGKQSSGQGYGSAEDYLRSFRIELVFKDTELPKRTTKDFYASSTRVNGQSNLVTVPDYKEFMDIYRITGATKEKRVPTKNRQAGQSTKKTTTTVMMPAREVKLPEPAPEEEDEEEYEDVVEEVEEEVSESDDNNADDNDDAFFITGVDDEGFHKPKTRIVRKVIRRRKAKQTAPPTTRDVLEEGDARPTVSMRANNVHAAVSELRNLLRKPLPHLPYQSTNDSSQRTKKK